MKILEDALNRISYQVGRLNLPVADQFVKGLTLREINAKLKNFPFALTTELRTLYLWRNGCEEYNYEFFPDFYMLSLDEALSEYEQLTMYENLPDGKWFPVFLHVMGGEYYYAELCDKEEKNTSHVYYHFIENTDSSCMAYDSLTAMMLTIAECYETGAFYPDDEGLFVEKDTKKTARITAGHNPKMVGKWLGEFGVEKPEEIVRFLRHTDGYVRGKAAHALMVLMDEKTVMPVCELLRDKKPEVREMAARLLGELRDSRAAGMLITALDDPDGQVRANAAGALGDIGDKKAADPLIRALENADGFVRNPVIYALGRLKEPKAVGLLVKILKEAMKERNESVINGALDALGEIKDRRATEAVIGALNDKIADIRMLAADTLGKLDDSRAVGPLSELLQDENERVRETARDALEKIRKNKS